MKRTWVPDSGWTGKWNVPRLLRSPITERERAILLSLSVGGLGPARLVRALDTASKISDLVDAHPSRTAAVLKRLDKLGARLIVPSDDEYPDELAEIDSAPPILFVSGERLDAMRPRIAIVGARACTNGAARFAERLGEAFAFANYTVVSGMARGVDGAAHRGALGSGRTIAVLGTGIDAFYPSEHRDLAREIAARGALVSEFPPGVGPRSWHFPARNRVISGMCAAVVVVEAAASSGALITAGFALDQGREVLACTVGPENPAGWGVREMLKDGATLVIDPEQAVEVMDDALGRQGFVYGRPDVRPDPASTLDGIRRVVYDAVPDEASTEDVARACGLDPARVTAVLSELELDGLVELTDGRWRRTPRQRPG